MQSLSLPRLAGWSGDPEKMGKGRNTWADVLKMKKEKKEVKK